MSSPSSSTFWSRQGKWIYDVFLSFRGADTRSSFASHLYFALMKGGIETFMDTEELQAGEEISASLVGAIEGSQLAIIIFSKTYANSSWCLDEVVKIMECQRTWGQVVFPIFYKVDPCDVRYQRGSYGDALERHERRFGRADNRTFAWRKALTDASNLSGFHFSEDDKRHWSEAQLIEYIVGDVSKSQHTRQLFVAEYPVGIKKRVCELTIELLEARTHDVHIVGIWGMGGLGKTTLAKAIYNEIGHDFKGRSLLANIREASMQDNGLVALQEQLVSDIIGRSNKKIPDIDTGKIIISKRVPNKKALVVLDDLDSLKQLKALCGSREWFHPGSVIIITTRDAHLLNLLEAKPIYRMREMDKYESLELFSCYAFKQASPFENFTEISREVVAYCGGLPLALEVLGSFLFDRKFREWKSVLSKLKQIPNDEIQAKLKISFDGLKDHSEKAIFLDICCFFINKDRTYITQILNSCELHAEIGIQVLIERSLIKDNKNNRLGMHDLLRDMGREIIRGNPPKNPEERSRLWFHKEVLEVLTEHTGTKVIEGIALKLPGANEECLINSEAFKEMKKLKLLQLDYVKLEGDYNYISKKLRWLCWHGLPLKYIPKNFHLENLVAIDFKHSKLKLLWKEPQLLERMKTLNLSHSCNLAQTPDFAKLPNLEKLIIKDCPSLTMIHESIGGLDNLLLVNLKDCKCLRDLPRSIYRLKSLKTLIFSGCSTIANLEEDIEQMESLATLIADNTAVTKVPFSLPKLKSLGYISLCGYEGRPQDVFPSLIWSWMSPMKIPESHSQTNLLSMSSLMSLDVRSSSFHGLSPLLGYLSKLQNIWEECRPKFQLNGKMGRILDALIATNFMELESYNVVCITRPADSFNSLIIHMGVCNKVDILKERILQGWNYGGFDDSLLPGDQYPDWFICKGGERSVFLKVPTVNGCCLKAMVFNIVYSSSMDNITSQFVINILIINYTKAIVQHHKLDSVTYREDEEWQGIISRIEPGDAVEFVLNIGVQLTINKIIAYLVYEELLATSFSDVGQDRQNKHKLMGQDRQNKHKLMKN